PKLSRELRLLKDDGYYQQTFDKILRPLTVN
ncbi:unnamed protein product, partial [marine sediment metagenome]